MRYLLLAIIILTSALFTFVHAQNEVARGAAVEASTVAPAASASAPAPAPASAQDR